MARDEPARGAQLRLCAAAIAWSLALILAAFVAPAYHGERSSSTGATIHTSATLVHVNGTWVLIPVAVPALLALVVLAALALRWRPVAVTAVIALAGFNVLAMFSIGVFVLPATVLLGWAVFKVPRPQRRQPVPA